MNEEITATKTEIKPSQKSNVIPLSSVADLGTLVGDIYNQLTSLIQKIDKEVSPEFKALMEGYINKANEVEELKVKLENLSYFSEKIQSEISQIRETNRNLTSELHRTREILKNIEDEFEDFQAETKKNETEQKDKIKNLNNQVTNYENKIKQIEEQNIKINQEREQHRQELLDQNFKFKQNEQEFLSQIDALKKQAEELESLLREEHEQFELKLKEAEYKDALLNQLIKQTTAEKLNIQIKEPKDNNDKGQKKQKRWPF